MIPYIPQPVISLGPVTLHWFGAMAALALVAGWKLIQRRARWYGLDHQVLTEAFSWVLGCGFVMGHILQILWYRPGVLKHDPWALIRIWESLSSFGGFVGIAVGCSIYFLRSRERFPPYGDALAYGIAGGWVIARLGCTLAHDHPGRPTDFFLAVDYPAGVLGGVARHNLGLYEAIVSLGIFLVLVYLGRRERKEGFIMGVLFVLYSVIRFFLDFLRATDLSYADPRYAGLTPAQWGCFVLLALGIYFLVRARRPDTPMLGGKQVVVEGEKVDAKPGNTGHKGKRRRSKRN